MRRGRRPKRAIKPQSNTLDSFITKRVKTEDATAENEDGETADENKSSTDPVNGESPLAGIHYEFISTNWYRCLGIGCEETGTRINIKTHCRSVCFPELQEVKRANRREFLEENRQHCRDQVNKCRIDTKLKEMEKDQEGGEPKIECPVCKQKFHTTSFMLRHKEIHLYNKRVSNYLNTLEEEQLIEPDSQESDPLPCGIFSEQDRNVQELIRKTTVEYYTYFAVIVEPEAEKIGLMKYLREKYEDPNFEVPWYVGKLTVSSGQVDDVGKSHEKRSSSCISNVCARDNKIAFQVKRNRHQNREAQEAEESWYQLFGKRRNRNLKSKSRMQWQCINIRFEQNGAKVLTPDSIRDARELAKLHTPLLCCRESCTKIHNEDGKRAYNLKFHVIESELQKLDLEAPPPRKMNLELPGPFGF